VTNSVGITRYPRACEPPWWARGGHVQTVVAHMAPSRAKSLREREDVQRVEIALADGDRLVALATPGTSGVRVHLFHGLSGDVDSDYVRRAAERASARGDSVWAVNHRGCGDGRGMARKPYHSGRSDDLRAVLAASRADAPELLRVAIGFSMSGNIALLHAGEPRPLAHAVIAVNPVVDLADASRRISQGFSRLYERRFVRRLRADLRERQQLGLIDAKFQIESSASLRRFDDRVTAPLGGFRDADDYYARCSSLKRLANVTLPTVVIAAADDPFLDVGLYGTAPLSSSIFLHIEPHGGHIGFLGRGFERWIDGALEHYVGELVRELRRGGGSGCEEA
jgi:predicted alpha/beta-fold hydrolase